MIQYMKHVINVKMKNETYGSRGQPSDSFFQNVAPTGFGVCLVNVFSIMMSPLRGLGLLFILFATNMPPLRGFEGVL